MIRAHTKKLRRRATKRSAAIPSGIRARRRNALVALGRSSLVAIAMAIIVGFLVLLLGPLAQWATINADHLTGKEKTDAINATRQILLATTGGTAVLVGLGFTVRTYYLSRRGQLTDRYTKAITQLASDKITERLGGIYALEHLMRESDADNMTIVAVLAAFIRDNAPLDPSPQQDEPNSACGANAQAQMARPPEKRPAIEVQTALTVLGRRPDRPEPDRIDLSQSDLRGAEVRGARLNNIQLKQSWLHYADFSNTDLTGAFLRGAQLQNSWLVDARLEGADLINARLEQANLLGVQLGNADLRKAQLRRAYLRGADLSSTRLAGACLNAANLANAIMRNANLAGGWISGRVNMKSIGYQGGEIERGEDLDGAQLQDATFLGAQMQGAHLVSDRSGNPAPVCGLTAEQLVEAHIDDATRLPSDLRMALADQQRQHPAKDNTPTPPDSGP